VFSEQASLGVAERVLAGEVAIETTRRERARRPAISA
jgi:hypothetical protein